jgi:adenosylhomocysteine nucleosidase
MRLLLIGADAMEFRGLLRHCAKIRRVEWPVDWARAATLGDREIFMAANGVGAARAARALETAPEADAVASVGFCGALDPGLRPGDVFVGVCVRTADTAYQALPLRAPLPHISGVVWSSGRVAQTAPEKAELRGSGASVVEMEAAGVAREAGRRNLPFYCLKAVTDLADEDLVIDFNGALRPDGHFDTMKILGSTIRRPLTGIPQLVRLRCRCGLAAQRWGDFLVDCRF